MLCLSLLWQILKEIILKEKKKKEEMSYFAHILDICPEAWAVIQCKPKPFALDVFGFTVHSSSSLVEIPPDKWEGKPNSSFSPPPIPAQEKLLKHKHFSWEGETTKG